MPISDLVQIVLYLGLVCLLAAPLGAYMARALSGERTFASPALAPVESVLCRLAGARSGSKQRRPQAARSASGTS